MNLQHGFFANFNKNFLSAELGAVIKKFGLKYCIRKTIFAKMFKENVSVRFYRICQLK